MHRLFVAIRPPSHIRDALIDRMEGVEGARWQDEEQLHITLRFIGDVERPLAEDIAHSLQRIGCEPFEAEIDGVGHFQRKGTVHAIWARVVPSPALSHLQRSVERACRYAGAQPETRAYTPHITLARLNRSSGPVEEWIRRNSTLRLGPWTVRHFRLIESHLGDTGSTYEDIARFSLPGG
jgi:2'-5' RNA ligase